MTLCRIFDAVTPATPADPQTLLSTVSLALNVVQTCFLAWLAAHAHRK